MFLFDHLNPNLYNLLLVCIGFFRLLDLQEGLGYMFSNA
jgi:hypothetical protein